MSIQSILNSIKRRKPRLLTLFTTYSNLRMLDDFEVYCLVNPHISEPRIIDTLNNALLINNHNGLEYDLCVSFSGGLAGKVLKDIAKEKNLDYLVYEMNYPRDLGDKFSYATIDHNVLCPNEQFASAIKAKSYRVTTPYISTEFVANVPVLNRPLVSTYCDFFIEKEQESHYSDWRDIINTIPSQIFGMNPKMGGQALNLATFAQALNSTKIYINTRTFGFFPTELLQAMACGCAVISYPYPGIETFIGNEFVVKNKEECRALVSKLLSNQIMLQYASERNLSIANSHFRQKTLTSHIMDKWRDTSEFGLSKYRV